MREMKDSGIEWIGEIPIDWETKSLKSILVERKENNNPIKSDYILSLTNDRGVIPYTQKGSIGNKSKEDLSGYKLAYPNDIVLNSMNVVIGSVGLSQYYGCVSPVYYMLYARSISDCNIKYYNYIFQTEVFQKNLKGYGNGIMEIRMRIPMSKLNTVKLPYVNYDTQQRIVDYLDKHCAKIDTIIEKTKTTIEEYKKLKQSIITEAVTIENCQKLKFKYCFNLNKGLTITKENLTDVGVPCVNYGEIHSKYGFEVIPEKHPLKCVSKDYLISFPSMLLEYGDFIFADTSEDKEGSGNFTYLNSNTNVFAGYHTIIARLKEKQCTRYIAYYLTSDIFREQIRSKVSGIKVYSISQNILKQTTIFLPTIKEQKEIAFYLDEKCSTIDNIITKKQTIITELESYKKSLIYECVTGKKEVI